MDGDLAVGARQDIEKLVERLEPDDRIVLQDIREDDLLRLHRGFGMWLRNQFRQNEFPHLFAYCNAKVQPADRSFDEISTLATREIWLYLRSRAGE